MRARVVAEIDDERVGTQHLMDAGPLHADAAAMHESHFTQAAGVGGLEIGLDDRGHVTRRERVEIELVVDRHVVRGVVFVVHGRWR